MMFKDAVAEKPATLSVMPYYKQAAVLAAVY